MAAPGIVHDERAVDPIAYIRALGLRPEDSYGFLPLDIHDSSSYLFLYRDRPEYAQARAELPGPESIRSVNLGMVEFDVGTPRTPDVYMSGAIPAGMATGDETAARMAQLQNLRDTGLLTEDEYQEMAVKVQAAGGGAAPAAATPSDVPALVIHRLYPKLYKRSSSHQLDFFMPRYRAALGLCPEDVYGVFPRSTTTAAGNQGNSNVAVWDDYWVIYRDRPEYAAGRAVWATEMNEPHGLLERMGSSLVRDSWPEAQVAPGVAEPGRAGFDGSQSAVRQEGWPHKLVMRKKGAELGEALSDKVGGWGYAPEDSLGFCPDFNSNTIFFASRSR
jgi:hypothetical protein